MKGISICRVSGCPSKVQSRGLCTMHYNREYRAQKRLGLSPQQIPQDSQPFNSGTGRKKSSSLTPIERFFGQISVTTTQCWIWIGTRDKSNYGKFSNNGKSMAAHKWLWEIQNGSLPEDLQLDHLCHSFDDACPGGDTCAHRGCVNPSHLEAVTNEENWARSQGGRPRRKCLQGHDVPEDVDEGDGIGDCLSCHQVVARRQWWAERLDRKAVAEALAAVIPPSPEGALGGAETGHPGTPPDSGATTATPLSPGHSKVLYIPVPMTVATNPFDPNVPWPL